MLDERGGVKAVGKTVSVLIVDHDDRPSVQLFFR